MSEKRKPTPEEKAECARLKSIWTAAKHDMGLSQEEMAAELGMTQGNLSHFLNGRQALSLKLILQLAVRFGFKPSVVRSDLAFLDPAFDGMPAGGVPIPPTRPTKKPKNDLASVIDQLDPETRKLILKLVLKLAGHEESQ